ncbi:CdaR family protein [Brevibacillus marinus]|uniref:CdaR family protein n=1 Tax=Brevibacillus marinus TaxID=2496837 RepID=UPI000F83A053|nr:CdaR family protein [Brevibacillus marinus]
MDKWLNSHWFVKGIALLVAVLMWMVVNLNRDTGPMTEASQPMYIGGVEIKVLYDEEHYDLVQEPPQVKVMVESSNPFYRYNLVTPDQYEVFVDARGRGKGTHRLPVQHRGFPEEARIGITPSMVEITLEEKQTVEKEVEVELLGQVAPGYTPGTPIVKPHRVHVKVPESLVDDVAQVKATVNLDGATEQIEVTTELKVLDKKGNVISKAEVNPQTVEVNVPVTSPFVVVPLKLNLTNDLPDGYSLASVQTNTEEVTVYGPQDVISKINTYPSPPIDLRNVKTDQRLQLKMPVLDRVVKVEPEYLEVVLQVVPSTTKRLENVPLRITGLADQQRAKVLTLEGEEITTLTVELVGAPQILEQTSVDDVQVLVDVSNLPAGVHEIPIVYNLPNYVRTSAGSVKQVTVEITNAEE